MDAETLAGAMGGDNEDATPTQPAAAVAVLAATEPAAAAPERTLEDLQRRKTEIESLLISVEVMAEAEAARKAAKENEAKAEAAKKAAKATDRFMKTRGDEGIAQAAAEKRYKEAKAARVAAEQRQKLDVDAVSRETIHDLLIQENERSKEMKAAGLALLDAKMEIAEEVRRLEKLAEETTKTAKEADVALTELKKRAKAKEDELKAINKELKSASSEAAKTAKRVESEAAKTAKKEMSEAAKAAKMEEAKKAKEAKEAKLAEEKAEKERQEKAEKERQEKVEMCEKLACAIHRFRHKVVKDLSAEADDIVNDLKKYNGCEQEGMPEEDQIVMTKEDALWFKELVQFVKKTERRLERLIENNVDSQGKRLNWRTTHHNHMIEDVCPEDEEEEQEGGASSALGKMYGTDSELDDAAGEEEDLGIVPDEETADKRELFVRKRLAEGNYQEDVFKHYAGVLATDGRGGLKQTLQDAQAPKEQAPAGATAPPPPGSGAQGQQGASKKSEGKRRITPIPQ